MKRIVLVAVVLCLAGVLASTTYGQGSNQDQGTASQNSPGHPPQTAANTQNQGSHPQGAGQESSPAPQSEPPRQAGPEPVRVTMGEVLTFYLHARLNSADGDAVDGLPKGSLLRVKMLDSIDSASDADGTEFHGTVTSGLASSGEVVIHPGSEVRGILALLRSRSHPEGFRYELLITELTDQGKSYTLTASLNPSLADSPVASGSTNDDSAKSKSSGSGDTH